MWYDKRQTIRDYLEERKQDGTGKDSSAAAGPDNSLYESGNFIKPSL